MAVPPIIIGAFIERVVVAGAVADQAVRLRRHGFGEPDSGLEGELFLDRELANVGSAG